MQSWTMHTSNESFWNEEIAGALGLMAPYQRVKVHMLITLWRPIKPGCWQLRLKV